ncbi:MAG TPA: hypothetical protein VH325_16060 [Bryobacteraceae bacterium]|nr:hypothetical protein [Bryobacteraceae bacterium]
MFRRSFLRSAGLVSLASLITPREEKAQEVVAKATRGLAQPKIRDISVIETQPAGLRLTVVKITTDQDGLYGYGCATFTQRADLVQPAVEKYLKPLLLGRTTDRIEDIWQTCYDSSYWRNGPVLNNAISGIDQALWDIKGAAGRDAGIPVSGRQVPGSGTGLPACARRRALGHPRGVPQVDVRGNKVHSRGWRRVTQIDAAPAGPRCLLTLSHRVEQV